MPYYAETRTGTGAWSPVKFQHPPRVDKRSRLVRADFTGPVLRQIGDGHCVEISAHHESLTLDQLAAVYSPDGAFNASRPQPAEIEDDGFVTVHGGPA